jgi:hypothetical protein
MTAATARRIDALVALSRDRSATRSERVLAAEHAARLLESVGISYLTHYPAGLPE